MQSGKKKTLFIKANNKGIVKYIKIQEGRHHVPKTESKPLKNLIKLIFITSSKQNVIQSGAFSPYETPDVMRALTSLKMTAKFILQSDGLTYFISDPTSDSQLKACEEWLQHLGWYYEVK